MQRKTAAQASGGAAAKDDDDEAHGHRPLDDDKDNDDDGKNTRLTLMEEVLLLGLKDREVMNCVTGVSRSFFSITSHFTHI